MRLFKLNLAPYLFGLMVIGGILACGTNDIHDFDDKNRTTGSYYPTLIFPVDIPREEFTTQVLTGIDCEAAQISTLEFSFAVNGSSNGPHVYACRDHQAHIKGVPVGTDVRVDVYAYNENHAAVLYGFETTSIQAGEVTQGGDIEMIPVEDTQPDNENDNQVRDEDGDGFSPPEDCDDTNPDINPDAVEMPNNSIDENCDGQIFAASSMFGIGDGLNMEFITILVGEFDMGSPVEELGRRGDETRHRVRLTQDFSLQTTEVTQGQWRMVVNTAAINGLDPNPSYFRSCGDDCPVESVSWYDAQLFIRALNEMYQGRYVFRLPTEAEWEFAARAGSYDAFTNGPITATGCGIDPVLDRVGWYCGNADVNYNGCVDATRYGGPACAGPHSIEERNHNAFDLFDMHGNVSEWCSDWYEGTYSHPAEPVVDPQGPSDGTERVYRGGSWSNGTGLCRSAVRMVGSPGYRSRSVGFRLVCGQLGN
jgi:formylglycine-generating enzyme required for sulfatase activity